STFTKTHGRQPASQMNDSIFAIFMVLPPVRLCRRAEVGGRMPEFSGRFEPASALEMRTGCPIGYRPGIVLFMTGRAQAASAVVPLGDSAMSVSTESSGVSLASLETAAHGRAIEAGLHELWRQAEAGEVGGALIRAASLTLIVPVLNGQSPEEIV